MSVTTRINAMWLVTSEQTRAEGKRYLLSCGVMVLYNTTHARASCMTCHVVDCAHVRFVVKAKQLRIAPIRYSAASTAAIDAAIERERAKDLARFGLDDPRLIADAPRTADDSDDDTDDSDLTEDA